MPWEETTQMVERVRFIGDLETCSYSMSELCELYGISRKTGYKWAGRFAQTGLDGLADESRAPKSCPHRTDPMQVRRIVELRRKRPSWGPRKLLWSLETHWPEIRWPALSTIGDILRREGLVEARKRRFRPGPPGRPQVKDEAPNDVWSSDFKGQFRTGDRQLCYPLTVADRYSRYLLGCQSRTSTAAAEARPVYERLFQEYGLPQVMLTDNGSPFASGSRRRLTRLSVWWLRLGILPVQIEPGHPEQNGRHERMHRTLKAETARPPASSLTAQQERFDEFRRIYNEERPHEALQQRAPAQVYASSPRPYPRRLPEFSYPGHFEVRRVRPSGEIKWKGGYLFLSEALEGEQVGLEEVDEGIWSVSVGPLLYTRLDERAGKLYD